MNWFEHLLSSELIYRMGYALFHSLWQGVLVALLLAGALAVIPRTKSSLRYWCGCIALFALPVLFCATAVLVGERENVIGPIVSETTTMAMDSTVTEKIDSSISGGGTGRIAEPAVSAAADIEPAEVPASATSWHRRLSDTVEPWTGNVVLCWFVGVFAMSVWNLGGWIAVRRLRCIGISAASERFVGMLGELAGRLGVKHPVRLLQSAVVQSPMTIGWLKPVILVPASILCELSPKQIETILAHELVHVRRFDYLVNLLQTVVETLLFHHPAVWWISHKIRSERECCCDDAVVRLTSDELNYAKALTAIADLRRDVPQLAVAAGGGSLLSRIQRILGLSNKKTLSGSTWLASLLALVICIAAAVSMVNAAASPPRDTRAQRQIVGTWVSRRLPAGMSERFRSITMTFSAHGTGRGVTVLKDGNEREEAFTYRFDGRKLLLGVDEPGDEPEAYRWNIRRNKLRLRDDKGLMEFVRVEKTDKDDKPGYIGTWEMIEIIGTRADDVVAMTFTLYPTGQWVIQMIGTGGEKDIEINQGEYTLEAGKLEISGDGDGISARIEGDRLIFTRGDIGTVTFNKALSQTARQDQLVGTWNMTQLHAAGDAKVTSISWTFKGDGTYRLDADVKNRENEINTGTYKFTNDVITMSKPMADAVRLIGNRIIMLADSSTIVFEKNASDKPLIRKTNSKDTITTSEDTAAETQSPVGTWDMIEGTGSYASGFKSVTVVFDADGRWTLESVDSKGQKDSEEGRYTFKGGRAWFRENDDIVIEFDAERMTMSEDDTTFTFKRRDDAETAKMQSVVGVWEMVEITGENAGDAGKATWTFNPDGTLVAEGTDAQGKSQIQTSAYTFKNGRISVAVDEDAVITIAGDLLTAIGGNTRAVFRKKTERAEASSSGKVDITPYVGTWVVSEDNQRLMYLLVVKPDGRAVGTKAMEPRQLPNLRIVDGQVVLNDGSADYAIRMQGDMLVGSKLEDGKPWPCTVRRFQPDPKIVGSWSATDIPENVYRTTAIFLDLKDDATFTLQSEGGGSSGVPDRGLYSTDGDMIRFFGGSSNNLATPGSARYHNGTIRIGLQHSTAVLKRDVANPFEGSEHPMFRVDLTSSKSGNGQVYLDLDTGKVLTKLAWDELPWPAQKVYELTMHGETGDIVLVSPSHKMLPVRDSGMNFAKAGLNAVKYLKSLQQSKLGHYHYKEVDPFSILTDKGNLAVVQMIGGAGSDAVPLAWSLARITQSEDDKPQVEVLTQTETVEETVEIKSRRVTLPDADTKNIPTILDLAGGEMLPFPDDIEGVDLVGHFTKLGKGDLLFDRLFAVLRGGKAQIWKDGQWTPLTPEDRQADATAYKLPESLPCRLLVTTGDGKQFDVNALARTADGGLEIEYKPVGAKVTMPGKEGAHSATHTMEYTVKPGDTLAGISEEMLGTAQRYPEIMKLNGLENADSLRAGMVLKLP